MDAFKSDNHGPRKYIKKMYNKQPRKKMLEVKEIEKLFKLYEEVDVSSLKKFAEFPLSQKSQKGLRDSQYEVPTDIQRESIGLALKGRDILGAAKTGSGKTIAFLIPVLEKLYLERWTVYDGLGALIITPTRELAYQIFEVLRKIGAYHDFSAGLIIGGKDLKFERKRMDKCNIIICTPGRVLQHMDENPLFDCTNLKILVLDEADRILDLGFEKTINAIIDNLPAERQTLLFSATQTRSVKDLARLSLEHPVYVSVHEHAEHKTPETLEQSYVICELHEKLNLLWSFLKTHLKQKVLVFMSSCKQVKYTYEAFCRMRPGVTVLALYGTLHQLRRMSIYDNFCRKQRAVLFATDIAARGLDFPSVNWVVQLDCPDDVKTYIHRAGRTARYEGNGESLLVLLPSEESMATQLVENKIPIKQISINKKKFMPIHRKLEVLCSRDRDLKDSAQRAFVSYLKSVFLMKDKSVFNIKKLNTDIFARSLGLIVSPRIRFLSKYQKQQAAVLNKSQIDNNITNTTENMKDLMLHSNNDDESGDDMADIWKEKLVLNTTFDVSDNESDDDFILHTLKDDININDKDEIDQLEASVESQNKAKPVTKSALVKKLLKKKVKPNTKIVFDEKGEPVEKFPTKQKSQVAQEFQKTEECFDLETAKQIMQEEDKIDKQLYRERIKAIHKEKKKKLKEEKKKLEKNKNLEQEKTESFSDDDDDEARSRFIDELPDPDKYKKDDSNDDAMQADIDDDNKEQTNIADDSRNIQERKRKLKENHQQFVSQSKKDYSSKKKKKRKMDDNDVSLDTGLSLMDDEELALRLISR